jgi:hypothetical protein
MSRFLTALSTNVAMGYQRTPSHAQIQPRWLVGVKGFGKAYRNPNPPVCSDIMTDKFKNQYHMPAIYYAFPSTLAFFAGWHMGVRFMNEWPIMVGLYDVYFPAHH